MLRPILEKSRFIVVVAVLGSLIAAVTLLLFGFYEIFEILVKIATGAIDSKTVVLKFIEIVDSFLLATVFLLIAVGLYELFVDPGVEMPAWLEIKSLDDLKAKLVGVVIIVLGVIFLGNTARWSGGMDIMYLGVGVGVVIAALTFFLMKGK